MTYLRKKFRHVAVFFLILLASLCPGVSRAQGLIETMVAQLLKLEVTLQELKQGYGIVQKGLTVIGDLKQGNLDLHGHHFSALMTVSPTIKGYSRLADIVRMEAWIFTTCGSTLGHLSATGLLSQQQLRYMSRVLSNINDWTGKDMDELTSILTDGSWQMTDDDRLARIDQLYLRVVDTYSFLHAFTNQVYNAAQQRAGELRDLQNITNLFKP